NHAAVGGSVHPFSKHHQVVAEQRVQDDRHEGAQNPPPAVAGIKLQNFLAGGKSRPDNRADVDPGDAKSIFHAVPCGDWWVRFRSPDFVLRYVSLLIIWTLVSSLHHRSQQQLGDPAATNKSLGFA